MEHLYQELKLWEDEHDPLSEEERLNAVIRPLCLWYKGCRRELPWRSDANPYRIWISEIMLQQTRVEAVKPYFMRFMEQIPDIAALADVSEENLLKLWEGLGYYSRARNLKKAAEICVRQYDGRLPQTYEELLLLPGIGSYTAGAIASIAYGQRKPAVDGNVLRVLHRVLASRDDILQAKVKKSLEVRLEASMNRVNADAGIYNQALMELGACVCIPNGEPLCKDCPLSGICLAHRHGITEEIPYRPKKKARKIENRTVCVVTDGECFVIRKRPDKGLLAGMYELPSESGRLSCEDAERIWGERLEDTVCAVKTEPGKHVFSHVEWHMDGLEIRTKRHLSEYQSRLKYLGYLIVTKKQLREQFPIPSAFSSWKGYYQMEKDKCGGEGDER